MLAFHAALLAPRGCWAQPVGMLLALLLTAGAISSVHSLSGLIGRRRQVGGSVVSVSSTADITTVTCQLDVGWQGHRPGQFAFITFTAAKVRTPSPLPAPAAATGSSLSGSRRWVTTRAGLHSGCAQDSRSWSRGLMDALICHAATRMHSRSGLPAASALHRFSPGSNPCRASRKMHPSRTCTTARVTAILTTLCRNFRHCVARFRA